MIIIFVVLIVIIVMAITIYVVTEIKKYKEAVNQFQLFTPKAQKISKNSEYHYFAISHVKGIIWYNIDFNKWFLNPHVEPIQYPDKYFCCSDIEKEMLIIINRYNKKLILSIINKKIIYL